MPPFMHFVADPEGEAVHVVRPAYHKDEGVTILVPVHPPKSPTSYADVKAVDVEAGHYCANDGTYDRETETDFAPGLAGNEVVGVYVYGSHFESQGDKLAGFE